jgi:hypothetical protein
MATSKASDLTLGNYLKIVSKGAVYNNLSEDSPIWDMISKKKKGPAEGRELRQLLRSAYGAAAAGFVPVTGGAYPSAHQGTVNELTAQYKDYALTVEVERTLIAKAMSDFSRYGEPLAEELRSKSIALSRQLSRAAYADGTGVIGQVASASASSNDLVLTLATTDSAQGFVGWFELGDKVKIYNEDGDTAQGVNSPVADPEYFVVMDKSRETATVTLRAYDSSNVRINVATAGEIEAGDRVYRYTQTTIPDVDSISTTDYGTLSEDLVGLESLSEDDGRKVHGITLSGALAGTRRDASGNPIDSQDFQQLMSKVMIAVGQGRYKYSRAMMAWETLDALIESRETDVRFTSMKDNKRGVESLGYQHGKNSIVFAADEFCRKDRIMVLPEADVLQFHGSDFEFVKPEGGQKFFLKPNASGHDRAIRAYMEGSGVLICNHAASIGTIHNFTC